VAGATLRAADVEDHTLQLEHIRGGVEMKRLAFALMAGAFLLIAGRDTPAHHSYAMFDHSRTVTLEGSVAKIEWVNPHVFVWIYVKKNGRSGEYDLYGFENGPVTMMMREGWTKDTLKVGEVVSVQFFPLSDGRMGGYFIKAVHADGRVSVGDRHAPGVSAELAKAQPAAEKTGTR
jgi:hypothetical protein